MKRKIRVILISSFLILGGTCLLHREHIPQPHRNGEPVVWQEFTCKDGAFSIQLPGTPTPLKESESLLQKLALSRLAGFSLERQDFPALFYVYYADVPEVYSKDRDGLLETTCSLVRFMKKGKLDVKKIEFEGNPGRETTMDYLDGKDQQVEVSRIYLVKNRFYQIAVVTPKNQASASFVTKYLDSFGLMDR